MTTLEPMTPPSAAELARLLLDDGGTGGRPAGVVVGVQAGDEVDIAVQGWATLPAAGDAGTVMDPALLLDVASVTKVASTTTLAMVLVDRGELDLNRPVRHFVPAFAGGSKDDITLEHLLTHTAGMPSWWPLYCQTTQRANALELLASLPLELAPGTAWRYSDLGMILAGQVLEVVSGSGLAEAFSRLVATPSGIGARYGPVAPEAAVTSSDGDAYERGMVATRDPYPVPFATSDFAGWRTAPLRGTVNDGNAAHALDGASGHAGLFATVPDLLTLGRALQDGLLCSQAVFDRFARPVPVHPAQAVGFRRREMTSAEGTTTVLYHGGFTGTFFALGVHTDLVLAAGAMRLHGTMAAAAPDILRVEDRAALLTTPAIETVLLDAMRSWLVRQPTTSLPPVEEA